MQDCDKYVYCLHIAQFVKLYSFVWSLFHYVYSYNFCILSSFDYKFTKFAIKHIHFFWVVAARLQRSLAAFFTSSIHLFRIGFTHVSWEWNCEVDYIFCSLNVRKKSCIIFIMVLTVYFAVTVYTSFLFS